MSNDVTFLVVEDDEVDLRALKRAFRDARIANPIVTAGDGLEALELLRSGQVRKPFIILLDINMPRMDGFEFMEVVRNDADLARSVIFVLTTSRDEQDVMKAYEQHVAGYVVKRDASQTFRDLTSLLDSYWRIVELPNGT